MQPYSMMDPHQFQSVDAVVGVVRKVPVRINSCYNRLCCAQFNKHCHLRYGKSVHNMPLDVAATAPAAIVDPSVYLPPALRLSSVTLRCQSIL